MSATKSSFPLLLSGLGLLGLTTDANASIHGTHCEINAGLYTPCALVEIDPLTAAVTSIGPVRLLVADLWVDGLAMAPSGTLYAFDNTVLGADLVRIDPSDAAATVVLPNVFPGLTVVAGEFEVRDLAVSHQTPPSFSAVSSTSSRGNKGSATPMLPPGGSAPQVASSRSGGPSLPSAA